MKRTSKPRQLRFKTIEEFDRTYFPKKKEKTQDEVTSAEPGDFGHMLANEFLARVRSTLRK